MATETTILIVDDEKGTAGLIEIYLVNDDYQAVKANDAEGGLRLLNEYEVWLMLLDIMIPGMDGLEMCTRIRGAKNIPIIMLSTEDADIGEVKELGISADDYVTKSLDPLEFTARVGSQLRRYTRFNLRSSKEEINPEKKGEISVCGFVINRNNHKVSVDGKEIRLTPIELNILYLLASNAGRVFSTDEIFQNVRNEHVRETTNTIMVYIQRSRGELEEDSHEDEIIAAVWDAGYKIEKQGDYTMANMRPVLSSRQGEDMSMDKNRRGEITTGKEREATEREFWKRFFVLLSLSLLVTAVALLSRRHRGGMVQHEI